MENDRRRDREVLETAAKLFHKQGYPATSVQDVADALDMLKGSLYYYIDTKEDLLYRLLDQVHDDVDVILEEVAAEQDLAPLACLHLYVRRQLLYNLSHLSTISVYYNDLDYVSSARRQAILRRREPHDQFVTGLIEKAQAEGEADSHGDAHVLKNCVFGTLIWAYRWYRPRAGMGREEVAEICANFATLGVVGDHSG